MGICSGGGIWEAYYWNEVWNYLLDKACLTAEMGHLEGIMRFSWVGVDSRIRGDNEAGRGGKVIGYISKVRRKALGLWNGKLYFGGTFKTPYIIMSIIRSYAVDLVADKGAILFSFSIDATSKEQAKEVGDKVKIAIQPILIEHYNGLFNDNRTQLKLTTKVTPSQK